MGRKYRWQDLAADADVVEPSLEAPVTLADDDVASKLAEMPAEGPGDGSLELLRVARRAIGLGVERDAFVGACARWNGQRSEPWDADDLLRRYDDARRRFDEEGLAAVPTGRYTRAALDTIVREDKRYAGRLVWDELEDAAFLLGGEGGSEAVLDDVEVTRIEGDICRRYGFPSLPRETLWQVLISEAHRRTRNRVTDYLAALPEWDGTSRDTGLVDALHVLDDHREIAAVYLRKMRISAIARAVEPGCKVDNMVVIVGDEGLGKSTLFRVLAGPDNFCDTKPDLESKDAYLQLAGAWFFEWSEIETIVRRSDVARVKGFLSSQVDRYRAPFARTTKAHPRRGIIVGSSNSHDLIQDLDSNRRYWIFEIEPEAVDLEWVREHRDQLWAEALAAYAAGESWFLTTEQEGARRAVNATFEADNPLLDRLAQIVAELLKKPESRKGLATRDIYSRLGVDPQSGNKAVFSTINSGLRRLGFVRKQTRIDGRIVRLYVLKNNANLTLVEAPESEPKTPEKAVEIDV